MHPTGRTYNFCSWDLGAATATSVLLELESKEMPNLNDVQRDLFTMMETELKNGNHDKAIEIAISSYFLSKDLGLDAERLAISQIYVAFASLYQKNDQSSTPTCSFCGRSGKDVKMGAGPDAFICDQCVGVFAEQLRDASD
jgi:hypothetical protein